MNAKTLFYRNLSSAIAKRFNTPFSTSTKPKQQVVADLLKTHFIDDVKNAKKIRLEKNQSNPLPNQSLNSSQQISQTIELKKITPIRTAQLEEKINKTIDPRIESKKRMAELLLKKIDLLEKTLKDAPMPKYDRTRLEKIISEKKLELLDIRSSIN